MFPLNIDYEEIFPKIFVYKSLLPKWPEMYKAIQRIEKSSNGQYIMSNWIDWFTYGTYCDTKKFNEVCEDLVSLIEISSSKEDLHQIVKNFFIENSFINDIQMSNSIAISHYIATNNVNLPEKSYITKPNMAKYSPDVLPNYERNDTLAMQFHTDYRLGEWYWPQDNFLLTCTTYLNHDYDGGEIIFSVGDNIIPYKPNGGEILVFPSGSPLYPEYPNRQPYFHATNSIKNKAKYFIRNYLAYECSGESLWFSNLKKYGEDWKQIAKKRSDRHNLIVIEFEDGNTFDLEKYFPGKKLTKYGSNLIPKFYDVKDSEYLLYDQIYEYEI